MKRLKSNITIASVDLEVQISL